jgi:hypothetical protein
MGYVRYLLRDISPHEFSGMGVRVPAVAGEQFTIQQHKQHKGKGVNYEQL